MLLASSLALAFTSCAASDSTQVAEPPVEGGLLVRVVDAEGRVVSGADVRASIPGYDASRVAEHLFAGSIGRPEKVGIAWRTDERGEVRIPADGPGLLLVARAGELWGTAQVESPAFQERFVLGGPNDSVVEVRSGPTDDVDVVDELTIVLEREESIRVKCRDRDGRPAIGSFVYVSVPETGVDGFNETMWGAFIDSTDGTIEIPHAQHWRSLRAQGAEVVLAGVVLWSDEMLGDPNHLFPDSSIREMELEVSSSGSIDLRADWSSADTMGDLRWIDAAPDPDDTGDVPEIPINLNRALPFSVPLGRRYEVFVALPGFVDPRVAFDGPKQSGERVEVVLPSPKPATQITGRLVDAVGNALARHEFEAHFERDGVRIEPEEDWLVTADDGRFALDVRPGAGGVLHVESTGSVMGPGPGFSATMSLDTGSPEPRPGTRLELARELRAGVVEVGDIVCAKLH